MPLMASRVRTLTAALLTAAAVLFATAAACGGPSAPRATADTTTPTGPPVPSVEVITGWADLGVTDVRFVRLNGVCFAEVRSEYDLTATLTLAENGVYGGSHNACDR